MTVNLVLINPAGRQRAYQGLATTLSAIEPPVWAGLVATFCRKRDYHVQIIDANAEELSPAETAQRVAELCPTLAAVVLYGHNPSASTQIMPAASDVCTAIKARNAAQPLLLLGGHVAALPERTLREEHVDFVCGGEGTYTVIELIAAIQSGAKDYQGVRGLYYFDNGEVRHNPPSPLVTDLDGEMPGIAWDLLPMTRYRAHNWHCFGAGSRVPYAAIYTTLGCPYRCTFCCIQAPFKAGEQASGFKPEVNSYRFWSPTTVLSEIDTLVREYGIRNIKFADEMFVLNRKHVHAICDGIIERGYDLNIWAYCRIDTVRDDETMIKLQHAGVRWLAFGIEAGTERVRDDVSKGFSQAKIFEAIERVRHAGIYVVANYIFGLPEDDRASMDETFALAEQLNAEYANFYCAMAYPGSQLYRQAVDQGWSLPTSWGGYSQHAIDTQPLPNQSLSVAEIVQYRDESFVKYFSNPKYLQMMHQTFGDASVVEITQMLNHQLQRIHQTI